MISTYPFTLQDKTSASYTYMDNVQLFLLLFGYVPSFQKTAISDIQKSLLSNLFLFTVSEHAQHAEPIIN